MAAFSLGKITVTPGTPIRLTANQTDPTKPVFAHSYMVQAWGATGGDGYVGRFAASSDGKWPALNKSTGAGVFGRIPKSTTTQYNYFSETCATSHDLFDLSEIAIDGDVSGDYLVSGVDA